VSDEEVATDIPVSEGDTMENLLWTGSEYSSSEKPWQADGSCRPHETDQDIGALPHWALLVEDKPGSFANTWATASSRENDGDLPQPLEGTEGGSYAEHDLALLCRDFNLQQEFEIFLGAYHTDYECC
jgi:hypothetical protein